MTTLLGPFTAAIDDLASPRRDRRARRAPRRRSPPPSRRRAAGAHQAAARGDQRQPVLEAEHAGDAGGDVLADAVAQHRRGSTPHDRHSSPARTRARTAPAACTRSRRAATSRRPSGYSTDSSGCGSRARSSASQRSSAARNTGCASYSARPMPAYCEPWPVNRNATRGGRARRDAAVDAPARRLAGERLRSQRRRFGGRAATTASRCAKCERGRRWR